MDSDGASRRRFIKGALTVAGLGALAGAGYLLLGGFGNRTSGTNSSSPSSTITSVGASYPAGKRFVIITSIADTPSGAPAWGLTQHTPQDVLAMLGDLKPDTLHRYVQAVSSPGLDPNGIVPGSDPQMTLTQFVQASMDASGSVVVPKLTLRTYDNSPDTFLSQARAFVDMQVDPPLSMLSLDEWETFKAAHGSDSIPLMEQLGDQLLSQGWKGYEVGACGAPDIPTGHTTFSLFCVDPTTWQADLTTLSQLKAVPSNKSFQLSIDYPQPIQSFQALTPDKQAELLSGFAAAQQQYGYSFVYPIALQGFGPANLDYDSTKIMTSGGMSLYDFMKGLMSTYN